jgi:hypothetical protein
MKFTQRECKSRSPVWTLRKTSPARSRLIHSASALRTEFEMKRQVGFFEVDERLQWLSDLGDQLEAYATVDFEIFRSSLGASLAYRMV